jgi:hypothetical protein
MALGEDVTKPNIRDANCCDFLGRGSLCQYNSVKITTMPKKLSTNYTNTNGTHCNSPRQITAKTVRRNITRIAQKKWWSCWIASSTTRRDTADTPTKTEDNYRFATRRRTYSAMPAICWLCSQLGSIVAGALLMQCLKKTPLSFADAR